MLNHESPDFELRWTRVSAVMGLVRNSRKMSEGPITYSYSENGDPLSAFYAIMDRILEWDIEVPDEVLDGLIRELQCQL